MVSEIAVVLFFIGMILETAYIFSQITDQEPEWKWTEDVVVLCFMLVLVSGFLIQENKTHWMIAGFFLLGITAVIYAGYGLFRQKKKRSRILNENSIRQAMDHLPCGICFADENGRILLCNLCMHELCQRAAGGYLQYLEFFTEALKSERNVRNVFLPGEQEIYQFPDGRIWKFQWYDLRGADGKKITELIAVDVTELYNKTKELQKENEALMEINRKLKLMYERISDSIREQETLAMKQKIHDEFGSSLLYIRKLLTDSREAEIPDQLGELEKAVNIMTGSMEDIREEETLSELLKKVSGFGVEAEIDGEIPEKGIVFSVIRNGILECATNCVRHAKGNRIHVQIQKKHKEYHVRITNNGFQPAGEIREGTGLSALRQSVEITGGTMKILWQPEFIMELTMPDELEK